MATDTFRRHARACTDAATRAAFATLADPAFFHRLLHVCRPVLTPAIVGALRNLADFADARIREPEAWVPVRGHPIYVVHALASHLFASFPVPRFLAQVWFGAASDRRRWFVGHAQGLPRRALGLPLTRRMIDAFLNTADHVSIDHALRRAEVLGLGGSEALADAVLATRIGEGNDDWRDALAWLVRSETPLDQVGAIVDFIHNNPDVQLRGRTFVSTLRLVDAWHARLAKQRNPYVRWIATGWRALDVPLDEQTRYAMVELLDTTALNEESRRMRHCVSSYAKRCARGVSSIWSLRLQRNDWSQSLVTVEVLRHANKIIQVRGHANRRATPHESRLVHRWASLVRLEIASYAGMSW